MIVRVAVEGIESALDLEGASWTPELVSTFLRMCGDEVMRVCEGLGVRAGEVSDALYSEEEDEGTDSDDEEPTTAP